MLVEEGAAAVEHSVCYTGGKARGQSEPEAGAGFEAEKRTAPSGCGRESLEAAAWESGGGTIRGNGQERRAAGRDAASWGSGELAWVLPACSGADWSSDLAFEADCRRPPPSLADLQVGPEGQGSRVRGLGSSEDLEMDNLSVQVCPHLLFHHPCLCLC